MRERLHKAALPTALLFHLMLNPWPAYASDDDLGCSREPAIAVPLVESGSGDATLCILPNRLQSSMSVSNLTPGNAYTVWWVYFDDPASCAGTTPLPAPLGGGASACDFDDFGGDRPLGVFGRMDSGIAPRSGSLRFSGDLGGMQPSTGAEVWMLVFGHGPANYVDGSALVRQLLTPEDPGAGAPHLGNTIDGGRGYPVSSAVFRIE